MSDKPLHGSTFFTGSYDGRIQAYDVVEPNGKEVQGSGHSNSVVSIAATQDGRAFSVAMDDTLRSIEGTRGQYSFS